MGTLGPPALAVVLLAVVWWVTVQAVGRSSDLADERRVDDRARVAAVFAQSLEDWLEAGRAEAGELASRLGSSAGPAANSIIASFLDTRPEFARSALLVDPALTVAAASPDRLRLTGRALPPCTRADATGRSTTDTGFADLLDQVRAQATSVVSRVFDAPGTCRPTVAAGAPAGSRVVVVFSALDDLATRVAGARALGEGSEFRIVGPSGNAVVPEASTVEALPGFLQAFVASTPDEPDADRISVGDEAGVEVIAAHAPAADGWGVVLTEDATVFDTDVTSRPAVVVAGVLTAAFAGVLVLVIVFELRRRRAHHRAEVAKGVFFSIVSHELRTPLTVLQGGIDTLHERWDDMDTSTRRSLTEGMPVQVHRLGRVVDRLLLAAHIYGGIHARPQPRPTALAEVIGPAVEAIETVAPLHEFEIDIEPGAETVRADPDALHQVLTQLLDNAVKYSPEGGTVTVTVRRRRRRVEVAVEDEGVGLPSDTEALFEAFTQAESDLQRVHAEGGVGVGLYIARSLVDQMGGRVRAERRPTGARFVISLRSARRTSAASGDGGQHGPVAPARPGHEKTP